MSLKCASYFRRAGSSMYQSFRFSFRKWPAVLLRKLCLNPAVVLAEGERNWNSNGDGGTGLSTLSTVPSAVARASLRWAPWRYIWKWAETIRPQDWSAQASGGYHEFKITGRCNPYHWQLWRQLAWSFSAGSRYRWNYRRMPCPVLQQPAGRRNPSDFSSP